MANAISEILHNRILLTGAAAWVISQVIKTIIHLIINHRIVWERLVGDGGMPSSHSATVCSVAVACGLFCGWGSPEFGVAFFLAVIVMHDARGVRQETGKQAVVINEMIDMMKLFERIPEMELKEFVGHTPLQVYVGILIGIANAFLGYFWYFPLMFS